MTLALPLVTCGFAGSRSNPGQTLSLPGKVIWSERMALPFVTSSRAPQPGAVLADPIFTVIYPVDAYIAIGANPDAAVAPQYFVPALTERSFYAEPGDRLSSVPAV